jgi:glycosyltransferase involved in cell wall biosynthesis
MSRKAVEAFLRFREKSRFTRGLVSWMGFRQTIVGYHASERFSGKSKYTIRKMLSFGMDGITSFSSKPLRITYYLGLIIVLLGLLYALYAIVQHLRGATVPGWTSILISVLIIGGVQLLSLGIIGEYIARIYNEAKGRPVYFIRETATK